MTKTKEMLYIPNKKQPKYFFSGSKTALTGRKIPFEAFKKYPHAPTNRGEIIKKRIIPSKKEKYEITSETKIGISVKIEEKTAFFQPKTDSVSSAFFRICLLETDVFIKITT